MNRKVIFDKPSIVDIDKLPKGAIFLVNDEPYMRILEMEDEFSGKVNSVHLCSGDLEFWGDEDAKEFDIEFFPNHQNIKIVGD